MKKKQFFEVRKIKMPGNFFTGTLFEINKEEKTMSKIQKLPEDMIKESAIWHMRRAGDRRFFCLSPLYIIVRHYVGTEFTDQLIPIWKEEQNGEM